MYKGFEDFIGEHDGEGDELEDKFEDRRIKISRILVEEETGIITERREDYYECNSCNINSLSERMCPCPRGGCDAKVVGVIKITEELKKF